MARRERRAVGRALVAGLGLYLGSGIGSGSDARAGEVAPWLADGTAREAAQGELSGLILALDEEEQHKTEGVYAAFEPSLTDLAAMPACDDDGDYVVVLSDGLLRLAESVAFAEASDELRGTHLIERYGALLARSQATLAPPLPPPTTPPTPPTTTAPSSQALEETATRLYLDLLSWLVADELAHVLAGDLVCPHPTAAHEQADDTWTPREHAAAVASAASRMRDQPSADAWATRSLLERGRSEAAVVAWLLVLLPLERAHPAGGLPWVVALHPDTAQRLNSVRSVADAWRHANRVTRTRG
jgi:hypothetical protein